MNWLKSYQTEVNQSLEDFFTAPPIKNWEAVETEFWGMLQYAVQAGGKRFRPVLALCCYELGPTPGCDRATAINIFRSLELLHAYSLVHDDLPSLDNDQLRRGQPTVWAKFGEANAVLVGDGLQTLAFENLSHTAPKEVLPALLQSLSQGAGFGGMLRGQVRDIYFEDTAPTLEQLEQTHHLKTGALITTSAYWGGLLGGLEDLDTLQQYAHTIGLLFQVKDDLLDYEGSAAQTGKAVGKDADTKGFVFLLGAEKTKARVAELKTQALDLAAKLQSDKLADMARYIADRDH